MHLMLSVKVHRSYIMLILVALVMVLFIFNAFLAIQMENNGRVISQDKLRKLYVYKQSHTLNLESLPHDQSQQYKIWNNVLSEGRQFYPPNVKEASIATQCSVNNLYHIMDIFQRWHGPISVGVFIPGSQLALALRVISSILLCGNRRIDHTSFHFVLPLASPPEEWYLLKYLQRVEKELHGWKCPSDLAKYLKGIVNSVNYANYNNGMQYPVNLLRNVAVQNIHSSHVMVIDIDMMPSNGLFENLSQFLIVTKDVKKTVFVVPAFEVKSGCRIPSSKQSLLRDWKDGCCRPFYKEQCWKCQKYTLYDKWAELSDSKALIAEYEATWHDPWEPFYIAKTEEVNYDERFKQYGFNRISQVCELHMANYRFLVLNNAFLVHKGFKEKVSFHSTKEDELNRNRVLYKQFKTEMITKYGSSSARC